MLMLDDGKALTFNQPSPKVLNIELLFIRPRGKWETSVAWLPTEGSDTRDFNPCGMLE
jgi:hypothetical protein